MQTLRQTPNSSASVKSWSPRTTFFLLRWFDHSSHNIYSPWIHLIIFNQDRICCLRIARLLVNFGCRRIKVTARCLFLQGWREGVRVIFLVLGGEKSIISRMGTWMRVKIWGRMIHFAFWIGISKDYWKVHRI